MMVGGRKDFLHGEEVIKFEKILNTFPHPKRKRKNLWVTKNLSPHSQKIYEIVKNGILECHPLLAKKRKKNVKKKKLKTIDILNSYSFSRQITEEMWKKWHFYLILGSTSEKKLENLEKFRIPVPFQRSFSLGKNGMSEKKIND